MFLGIAKRGKLEIFDEQLWINQKDVPRRRKEEKEKEENGDATGGKYPLVGIPDHHASLKASPFSIHFLIRTIRPCNGDMKTPKWLQTFKMKTIAKWEIDRAS